MTIPLLGTGGLFTREGKNGAVLNSVNSFRGTANLSAANIVSIGTGVDNLSAQYLSPPDQFLIDRLYSSRDAYRGVHKALLSYLQTLFQNTIVTMTNDDVPLPTQSLSTALPVLISQMKTSSDSVSRPTVSVTVTAGGSNVGDGVCVATVTDDDGGTLDYLFNENVPAVVSNDSFSGTAVSGRENFSLVGPAAQADVLDWSWPLGSGTSLVDTAIDGTVNNSPTNNRLFNSGFDTFVTTPNVPDRWTLVTGVAGTDLVQGTGGNVYDGAASVGFVGGATNTALDQQFNSVGGTHAKLMPLTTYICNFWLKMVTIPAAGVLRVALVNESGGAVINDAAGNPNSFTITLSGTTGSFVSHHGVFRTPAVLPATYGVRFTLTTALSSGSTMYLDRFGFAQATNLYAGGPKFRLFSGTTPFALGDRFTLGVANNYSSKWALLLERMLGLRSRGLKIPSAGSPTISDSLVA
jgi:hypothetical protein